MSGFNLSRWALGHQQLVGFLLAIASVAGLLITTGAMVAEKPKKDAAPALPAGGMDY